MQNFSSLPYSPRESKIQNPQTTPRSDFCVTLSTRPSVLQRFWRARRAEYSAHFDFTDVSCHRLHPQNTTGHVHRSLLTSSASRGPEERATMASKSPQGMNLWAPRWIYGVGLSLITPQKPLPEWCGASLQFRSKPLISDNDQKSLCKIFQI